MLKIYCRPKQNGSTSPSTMSSGPNAQYKSNCLYFLFACVDLSRIELLSPRCKRGVLPFNYRPTQENKSLSRYAGSREAMTNEMFPARLNDVSRSGWYH